VKVVKRKLAKKIRKKKRVAKRHLKKSETKMLKHALKVYLKDPKQTGGAAVAAKAQSLMKMLATSIKAKKVAAKPKAKKTKLFKKAKSMSKILKKGDSAALKVTLDKKMDVKGK